MPTALSLSLAIALALAAGASAAGASSVAQPPQSVSDFLRERARFSGSDIAAIEAGESRVEILPGRTGSETRLVGVVKIKGAPERFVEDYRNIESFERGAGVLAIGRFSDPPREEDLATLTLDRDDLEGLRECRRGDCSIKLDEDRMEAFQALDWSAPDAAERATSLARRMIVDFLASYQRGGNRALGAIHDKKKPLLVRAQFAEMLSGQDLPVNFPELYAFLMDFPGSQIPGAEQIFYWSKVDFGLKPIVRLSHVVIYRPRDREVVRFAIASKMLWASHYFNTGLEMKFLAVSEDSPGFYYLVASNRSRSDGLTGLTGSLIGGKVRSKARDALARYLQSIRSEMESEAGPLAVAPVAAPRISSRPQRSKR
jgi:hypothetical protein